MKKITILMLLILSFMTASAQNAEIYQGTLEAKAIIGEATNPDQKVYVEKNEDGTFSLKVYNLVAYFKNVEYAIGNVEINNFTKNGYFISTKPKSATEDNIIITDGDDPNYDWLFSPKTTTSFEGSATMTPEKLSFSIPLNVKIGILPTTVTLTYNGKHIGTGINSITKDSSESVSYSIEGIKATRKTGLIIKDGKKVIIR